MESASLPLFLQEEGAQVESFQLGASRLWAGQVVRRMAQAAVCLELQRVPAREHQGAMLWAVDEAEGGGEERAGGRGGAGGVAEGEVEALVCRGLRVGLWRLRHPIRRSEMMLSLELCRHPTLCNHLRQSKGLLSPCRRHLGQFCYSSMEQCRSGGRQLSTAVQPLEDGGSSAHKLIEVSPKPSMVVGPRQWIERQRTTSTRDVSSSSLVSKSKSNHANSSLKSQQLAGSPVAADG